MHKPSIGRIVLYVVSEHDARLVNERRAEHAFPQGINLPQPGDVLPLIICRVWTPELYDGKETVNGQLMLDGGGVLWKTSVHLGEPETPGTWHWPKIEARPLTHAQWAAEQVVAQPAMSAGKYAGVVAMMSLLELKARRLCAHIEALPPSPALTHASIEAANIRTALEHLIEERPIAFALREWLEGR